MSMLVGAPRLSECCYHPRSMAGTLVTAHVVEWDFDEKCCRYTFKQCAPTCTFVCDREQDAASAIIAKHILDATDNLKKVDEARRLLTAAKNGMLQVVITGRTAATPPC